MTLLDAKEWDGEIKKTEINIKGFDGWTILENSFNL